MRRQEVIASLLPLSLITITLFWPALSAIAVRLPLPSNWVFSEDVSLTSPLPRNAHSDGQFLSLFVPVLSTLSFSSGKGFSLGFYSSFSTDSSIPASIFLTVCLGANRTDSDGLTFALPVWHLDRSRSLRQLGRTGLISLEVKNELQSKELVLRDGDGTLVWSMKGVESMELQDNGNWVLYNAQQQVLWQSFDFPTNTLVKGQYLDLGSKLFSENSRYAWEMKPGGLIMYINSKSSPVKLVYFLVSAHASIAEYITSRQILELPTHPTVNLTKSLELSECNDSTPRAGSSLDLLPSHSKPYGMFRGFTFTITGLCANADWAAFGTGPLQNVSADFVSLLDNGYPLSYSYMHTPDKNSLLTGQDFSTYCLVPDTCGAYGLCTDFAGIGMSCRCPSASENIDLKDAFDYIDPSQPSRGCRRRIPLRCLDEYDGIVEAVDNLTRLVEIKKATIVSLPFIFETTYAQNRFALTDCRERCVRNCSCSGFYFHKTTLFCLPFSDEEEAGHIPTTSFIFHPTSSAFSVFIKLQSSIPAVTKDPQAREKPPSKGHFSIAAVVAPAVTALVLVLLVGAFLVHRYMTKSRDSELEDPTGGRGEGDLRDVPLPLLPTRYSFKELQKATRGFSSENFIGLGGFGRVYLGDLPDGRKVAVKMLEQSGSPRKFKQFLAEVAIIGGVSHCNITPLRGFCSQKTYRLLVYEYMDNSSLDMWLFSDRKDRILDWATRFQIAVGAARGLAYLHEECSRPIIHFDVKPQNILLDKNFVAKISDFGMCKLVGKAEQSSCVMTGVRGTPGYLAPEWLAHSIVGKKSDVYSFGMVLFELVGGRKNAVQELVETEQWYLPRFAAELWKEGRLGEMVDRRLQGVYEEEQVRRMIHVAFMCIQMDPSARPAMGAVCKIIEGSLSLGEQEPPFDMACDFLAPYVTPHTPDSPVDGSSYMSSVLIGR